MEPGLWCVLAIRYMLETGGSSPLIELSSCCILKTLDLKIYVHTALR